MAIYLVQHGKSLPKDVDPERGLSDEGIAEVKKVAAVAGNYGVTVAAIAHSGKKRARETAELFAAALNPAAGVSRWEGLDPLDDVAPVAATVDPGQNLMLVGHLPFVSRLNSFLITGEIETEIFAFQNGGIVCMDRKEEDGRWLIKWTLMPNIS